MSRARKNAQATVTRVKRARQKPPLITKLYAFVVDDHGEAIVTFRGLMGPLPMVTSDESLLGSLRLGAESVATERQTTVRLVEFRRHKECAVFLPLKKRRR
jgi:hypothetical protein